MQGKQLRQYDIRNAAAFRKTKEKWGGLSNMAAGFPLCVNDIAIQSSEVLYQACRFPHNPDIQQLVLSNANPMDAKKVARAYEEMTRNDWEQNRVLFMKWCLRVKLAHNWDNFSAELLATGDMPIVEVSSKDGFWGAIPDGGSLCTGANVLGRLLMQLREQVKSNNAERFWAVPPLNVDHFLLLNQPIPIVCKSQSVKSKEPKQQQMF
ncbi:NADAR family protein [Vibrio splendidus]